MAWTDQPSPSASISNPPASDSGHVKRASVFGSAQFSRPPWTEAIESTAMKGIDEAGSGHSASSTGEPSTSW